MIPRNNMTETSSNRIEGGLRTRGEFHKKSEPGRPLISVITVVRDGEKTLEQTILSVLDQRYDNIEYIIIDGGSTDGTLDIVRKYEDKVAYWLSEPDEGIYDAMNKAIGLMSGKGHIFLNAGDFFVSDVFTEQPKVPSFIPVYYRNFFGNIRKVKVKNYRQGIPYCHQGIIFESKGIKFDIRYQFASDYLYYLDHGYTNEIKFNESRGHVYYDNAGHSKKNSEIRDSEIASIIRERFGSIPFLAFQGKVMSKNFFKNSVGRFFQGKGDR